MGLWKARRRRAAYARLVAKVSEHDVIWAAEEIVGGAWMAGLADAENQATTARQVCTHMRDDAYESYRSAESERDAERLSDSARELAVSRQALGRLDERCDKLREFAERERAAWEQAEWMRTLEVLADRDRLREAQSRLAQPNQTVVGRRPTTA
jgi:hypothetical protein